jgi:hypothetical protein
MFGKTTFLAFHGNQYVGHAGSGTSPQTIMSRDRFNFLSYLMNDDEDDEEDDTLLVMILASVPFENKRASFHVRDRLAATTTTTPETGSSSSKKRKRGESDIALAIRDFSNSKMSAEPAKQKLQFMQKEDARPEQKSLFMQKEDVRQEHKSLFEEWEKVQLNIRLLRQDIRDTSIDATARAELQEDIDFLVKRKNKLAFELGLK